MAVRASARLSRTGSAVTAAPFVRQASGEWVQTFQYEDEEPAPTKRMSSAAHSSKKAEREFNEKVRVTERQVVVNVEGGPAVAFDKMIPMPLEQDLIMCMACCCIKYSIYKKVPECLSCTAKNECYKYALQERCSFNPTLFFQDCKCALCDCREGNDIKDQGCGYTFGK